MISLLSPTNDYVFKRLFGYKGCEEITTRFLKSIIKKDIRNLKVTNQVATEKGRIEEKDAILDVRAESLIDNIQVNIEMQVAKYSPTGDRLLYYWSKLYNEGLNRGEDFNNAKKTIVILIADYIPDIMEDIQKMHTEWHITEKDNKQVLLTEKMEFHIISLKRLGEAKNKEELLDWLNFISNPEKKENYDMVNNKELEKAYEILEDISSSEEDRIIAEGRIRRITENNAMKEYGRREGIKENKKEMLQTLMETVKDIDEVSRITKIPKEEIESIIEEKK